MKALYQSIAFSISWILILFPASAQEISYQFNHLTIDEGLAHTDATCIAQDHQGFIWVGTYFGLNRYDGYQLKSFYNQNHSLRNVYTNRINDLCIDQKGRIWLATHGGVECFDPSTESYLELNRQGNTALVSPISDIYFDVEKNKLIVGGDVGLAFFELTDVLNLKQLQPEQVIPIGDFRSLTKGPKAVWLTGSNGLFRVQLSSNGIEIESITIRDQEGKQYKELYTLKITNQGLWIGTNTGLLKANPEQAHNLTAHYYPLISELPWSNDDNQDLAITSIQQEENILWLGTDAGLIKCDISEDSLNPKPFLKKEPISKNSLTSNHISDLYIDQSNCLWLSTFGGGVNFIDLNQKQIHLLQKDPKNPKNSLSGNYIRALAEDKHANLWIGTRESGLNYFDFESKQFKHFFHQNNVPTSLSSNKIRSLAYDKQGKLWVGTHLGLNIFKEEEEKFERIYFDPNDPNSLSGDVIFALACDNFGQMWAGTWHNGINRIICDETGNYQIQRITNQSSPWKLSSNKVSFISSSLFYNEIFVGTDNGLNHILLDEKGDIRKINYYKGIASKEETLSSNFIWPIVQTAPKTLWVGTIGGGLNKIELLNNEAYKARHFSVNEGAPSRDIESILVDDNGNLWLGGRGLSMFDPHTETFTNYDVNDGLQSNSFKIGAAYKGKNGRLYFGGINGLNYFYPEFSPKKVSDDVVVFTDLIVNNERVLLETATQQEHILKKDINQVDLIQLSHLDNNFSLVFSSLNFANPDNCKFKYKLEGYDEDWVFTDAQQRRANYSNLDYGNYELKVFAANNDGDWSTKPATLNISIIAPWWWTGFAKFFYALLSVLFIIGVFYYFTRWYRLKKAYEFTLLEEQQMEALHKMRLQFFTNISHEFKTPLTLIINPLEQLIKGEVSKRKQHRYFQMMRGNARRLLNLINELMDFRKIETGAYKLSAEKSDLSAFAEEIFESFREHALLTDIDFSFRSEGLVDNCWFDKKVVEKIMLNLLGNAFKYTQTGGSISLEIFEDYTKFKPVFKNVFKIDHEFIAKDYIWIKVADTGEGMPADTLHLIFDRYFRGDISREDNRNGAGVGLALVKSMVTLHKGKLRVFSEVGKGTTFLVGIPKGTDHLNEEEIILNQVYKKADYDLPPLQGIHAIKRISVQNEIGDSILKSNVMIVEDNHELRLFIKEHFEGQYNIIEAENGKEALRLLKNETVPDIIISDVMMPQLNGIEFCKIVKQDLTLNHIPFILLTAKASIENRVEGIQSGADIYLAKPFSIDELQLTIKNILASRKKLHQLYLDNAFSKAREVVLVEKEKDFLDAIVQIIETNLDKNDFDVDHLCREIGMSRTKLYNKVKIITGRSVGEFIRSMRLQKAAQILASEDISVVQVMYRVGIQSQSYFTKSFKKEFGKTPSQYVKEL